MTHFLRIKWKGFILFLFLDPRLWHNTRNWAVLPNSAFCILLSNAAAPLVLFSCAFSLAFISILATERHIMQRQLPWHYLHLDRSACHCARAVQLCINIKQLGRPAACLRVLQRCKRGRGEPPSWLRMWPSRLKGQVSGENAGVKIQKRRGTHIVGCQVRVQVVDAWNGIWT